VCDPSSMRRPAALLACAALLAGCGAGEAGDEATGAAPTRAPERELAREPAPPPLAAIRAQAGELLGGGADAFERRLRKLRGHPIVVNKWASWCPPCRAEFPFFRAQARLRGHEVAFLGVDSNDNDDDARRFLAANPVDFPSYSDPKLEIAALFEGVQAFPSTAFYDRRGELAFLHQGSYASEARLAQDIERYSR
jgi:cytochrome c biogenesis protein CcmG, thiol:disulfide interchange protein DsbE